MNRTKIAREWDAIAKHRCDQIASGKDVSHDRVLVPCLLRLAKQGQPRRILDIGSGCGFFTAKLPSFGREVLGIDISKKMVLQAKKRFFGHANLSFAHVSLEDFASSRPQYFDLAVSNMAVNTMENLSMTLKSVFSVLKRNGRFVFSITHPCFWNCYRHAEPSEMFDYWRTHSVTASFRITLEPESRFKTTYFHRSLATYLNGLVDAGFEVNEIVEPHVPKTAPTEYRRNFRVPRFLVISAEKQGL
jgi:SAM-dependent methyltransferase